MKIKTGVTPGHPGLSKKQKNQINAYYSEAGPDYETWSKAYVNQNIM